MATIERLSRFRLMPGADVSARLAYGSAFGLFLVAAAVFWPACENEFVNWDDNDYVSNRDEVLAGINWNGLIWAATANVTDNWHPLTLLSLQLDAQLFGTDPRGFHRTSVLLHALNAALAFHMFLRLTGQFGRSFIAASLFALHPMRVESVAWISERKDLVSGLFFLLTILTYVSYARSPSLWRYLVVACCLGLGLGAKPMLVTTPCVLLLLDHWPLNRLAHRATTGHSSASRLVMEKLPLFGLAVLDAVITVFYQQTAIKPMSRFTLFQRFENAADAIACYLVQTIWPLQLSPFYPFQQISDARIAAAFGVLIAISCVAVWQVKRRPYFAMGWFWFLGMLVPVCGLIQVGNQARADRYTYLPHLGLFLAIVWTIGEWVQPSRLASRLALALYLAFLALFLSVIPRQITVWHDTESIWKRAHEIDSSNGSIIDFWLTSLVVKGKWQEASRIANDAIERCDETDISKMRMLITFLLDLGENKTALRHLDRALKHHPDDVDLIVRKGRTHGALGNWLEAAAQFRRASRLMPGAVTYQFFLAYALDMSNQSELSKQTYATALRQSPNWADEAANHAWTLTTSWKARDRRDPFWAVCLAEQANIAAGQNSSRHLDVLAAAYANAGDYDKAIEAATRALELANTMRDAEASSAIRERLSLYEQRIPYRQPKPDSLGSIVY